MNNRPPLTPYIIMALSFVGLAVTAYLSLNVFNNTSPACAILHGCDTVLHSSYSKIFGVPLAYIGIAYYAYMLGLSILLVIDPRSFGLRLGVLLYATIGLLNSIAFESIQAFLIHALCLYCALSALTTLAFFIVAIWHFKSTRTI